MRSISWALTAFFIVMLMSCQQQPKINSAAEIKSAADSIINLKLGSSFLSKHPLAAWMRKSPVEIGCMLESEFSYKDSVFNCGKKSYVNKGDPCKNTTEYYEGIKFPNNLASKVNPLIKEINLDFEHGNLREVTITFRDSILKNKVREIFNLPQSGSSMPENVTNIGFGENVFSKEKPFDANYTRWLSITSFDHMGAGDVDCE